MAHKGLVFTLTAEEANAVEPYYEGLIPFVYIKRLGVLFCHGDERGRLSLSQREVRDINPRFVSCCYPKRVQRHLKFVGIISAVVLFAEQYDEEMMMVLCRYTDGTGELRVRSYGAHVSGYAVEWKEFS